MNHHLIPNSLLLKLKIFMLKLMICYKSKFISTYKPLYVSYENICPIFRMLGACISYNIPKIIQDPIVCCLSIKDNRE